MKIIALVSVFSLGLAGLGLFGCHGGGGGGPLPQTHPSCAAAPPPGTSICKQDMPPGSTITPNISGPLAALSPTNPVTITLSFHSSDSGGPEDTVQMLVEDIGVPKTEIWLAVQLGGPVNWQKEIKAWNRCTGQVVSSAKAMSPGPAGRSPYIQLFREGAVPCGQATHAIVFSKPTGLGVFWVDRAHLVSIWNYTRLRGTRITFTWIDD